MGTKKRPALVHPKAVLTAWFNDIIDNINKLKGDPYTIATIKWKVSELYDVAMGPKPKL